MEVESTLSSYRIFNAVAEAGNLSKAAKELLISQPAISKAVSKLEQSLSVKLFTRNSRGVKLTEEGALLYEYTHSAFEALRQGEESIKKRNSFGMGHIKIGVSTTLCKHVLLPYLQSFMEQYPHIKISVECRTTAETLALLEDGKLDIALVGKTYRTRRVEFLPLLTVQDTFVTGPSYLEHVETLHPGITGRPKEFLQQANLMLLDRDNLSRLYVEDYFTRHNLLIGQTTDVSTMDLLIEFSKIGLGIGCVIKEFVEKELEEGILHELPLSPALTKRTVGFAYNKLTAGNDSMKRFIDFYKGESHT